MPVRPASAGGVGCSGWQSVWGPGLRTPPPEDAIQMCYTLKMFILLLFLLLLREPTLLLRWCRDVHRVWIWSVLVRALMSLSLTFSLWDPIFWVTNEKVTLQVSAGNCVPIMTRWTHRIAPHTPYSSENVAPLFDSFENNAASCVECYPKQYITTLPAPTSGRNKAAFFVRSLRKLIRTIRNVVEQNHPKRCNRFGWMFELRSNPMGEKRHKGKM